MGDEVFAQLTAIKGNTKIIASYHDLTGNLDWASQVTKEIYENCCQVGDMVQIVGWATKLTDNYELENFRRWCSADCTNPRPLIAFNGGAEGKLSRILNPFLQPTTHHLLPISSAPHQLTVLEANRYVAILLYIRRTLSHHSLLVFLVLLAKVRL
jgi:3-dehydroquinate dehydratase type I